MGRSEKEVKRMEGALHISGSDGDGGGPGLAFEEGDKEFWVVEEIGAEAWG